MFNKCKKPLSKGAASRAAALKRRHESPHKPNVRLVNSYH